MQAFASTPAYTSYDYGMMLIVLISAFMAFAIGIIKAVLSLVGLIVGIVVASWEYSPLAARIGPPIVAATGSFGLAQVLSFFMILVLVMLLFALFAQILRKTAHAIGLGLIDRLLGALFGAARGVLIGVTLTMALTAFMPGSPWLKNSQLSPYFLAGFHEVSFIVPQQFQDQIAAGARYFWQEAPEIMRLQRPAQHR